MCFVGTSFAVSLLSPSNRHRYVTTQQQRVVFVLSPQPSARLSRARIVCFAFNRWSPSVPFYQGKNLGLLAHYAYVPLIFLGSGTPPCKVLFSLLAYFLHFLPYQIRWYGFNFIKDYLLCTYSNFAAVNRGAVLNKWNFWGFLISHMQFVHLLRRN